VSYAAVIKIEDKIDKSKTSPIKLASEKNIASQAKIDKPTNNSKDTIYNLRATSSKIHIKQTM
jgi:hypothetical protein